VSLILIRHTRPEVADGIGYGSTDLPAAPGFEAQVAHHIARFTTADRIVSSPLRRCLPLAEFLAERLGAPLTLDTRWREMDFGAWEGRAWETIARSDLDAWAADLLQARPHGGESVAMLSARTGEAISACRATGGRTLVVTHAGPMRAALGDWNRAIAYGEAVEL
jgi:alpha-ribazole phosphatase